MADEIVYHGVIYAIKNLVNGKIYVGSTINFDHRKKSHLSLLKRGKHHSRKLQMAWNKYGEDSFVFLILKEVDNISSLHVEEQSVIDALDASGKDGYNIAKCAGAPMTGRKHTEEAKAKIGKAFAGIPKKHPLVAKGSNIPRCTVDKIAKANTGQKRSEETKRKISEAAKGHLRWLGRTHTEETKRKISEKAKAREHHSGWNHSEKSKLLIAEKRCIAVEIDGVKFCSYIEAAKHYSRDPSCIGLWVKSGRARKLDA